MIMMKKSPEYPIRGLPDMKEQHFWHSGVFLVFLSL